MSLSSRGQKAEERDAQSSYKIKVAVNNSVIGLDIHKGPNMNHNNPCLGLKSERKRQEVASRREEIKVCDVMDDDMIMSPDTTRSSQRVRLIARKPQKKGKSAPMYSVGDFLKLLLVNFRTITFIALLLAITADVTHGLVNVRPYERKTLVGNWANFLSATSRFSTAVLCFLLMVLLHDSATLTAISAGFCLYMSINSLRKHNERPKKRNKRLHNPRMRNKQTGYSHNLLGYEISMMHYLARPVLAGKCLHTYIYLFTHFWAVRVFYISRYVINLGLGDNYQVLIGRIYLYIYVVYRSGVSRKGATHFADIFIKSYTLVYFLLNLIALVVKSHDKYQDNLLVRLGHAERAFWEKRSIFDHNRSYWRELRPLVTPWAFCIKGGTEPWKNQTRSLTSHVQVRNSLLSLSLSLSPLLLSCHALLFLLLLFLLCIVN